MTSFDSAQGRPGAPGYPGLKGEEGICIIGPPGQKGSPGPPGCGRCGPDVCVGEGCEQRGSNTTFVIPGQKVRVAGGAVQREGD